MSKYEVEVEFITIVAIEVEANTPIEAKILAMQKARKMGKKKFLKTMISF